MGHSLSLRALFCPQSAVLPVHSISLPSCWSHLLQTHDWPYKQAFGDHIQYLMQEPECEEGVSADLRPEPLQQRLDHPRQGHQQDAAAPV